MPRPSPADPPQNLRQRQVPQPLPVTFTPRSRPFPPPHHNQSQCPRLATKLFQILLPDWQDGAAGLFPTPLPPPVGAMKPKRAALVVVCVWGGGAKFAEASTTPGGHKKRPNDLHSAFVYIPIKQYIGLSKAASVFLAPQPPQVKINITLLKQISLVL